jgi:exodeoxyribonuclease-3
MLKIASWNVNSLNVRLPLLLAWADGARPDILALQETKLPNGRFPTDELAAAGYHSVCSGQPTYNGVAILSREKTVDIVTDIQGLDDPQRRILALLFLPRSGSAYADLYVVNGSEVRKFAYKLIGWKKGRWLTGEAT